MNKERLKIILAQNGTYVALVALVAFFTAMNPRFLSPGNIGTIVQQSVELGVVALPMALLIMSGSINFSVGSAASLAAVASGLTMQGSGSFWLGALVGLATGAFTGVVNGALVSYLGLNPFVVTLGFLSVWAGLALLLTNGRSIGGPELPTEFATLAKLGIGPVSLPVLAFLVMIVGSWWLLNRTAFGRQVLAVGGNRRAAELMGVPWRRVQFLLFVAGGVAAGLAGQLLAMKVQTASPIVGVGLEIDALTVCLLGGVAIAGGYGRISGVIAGLLLFRVLRNGLAFLQAPPYLQTVLIGLTLVLAVAFDSTVQRVVKSSFGKLGRKAVASAVAEQSAGGRS